MSRAFAIPTAEINSLLNLPDLIEVEDGQTYDLPDGVQLTLIQVLDDTYRQPYPSEGFDTEG